MSKNKLSADGLSKVQLHPLGHGHHVDRRGWLVNPILPHFAGQRFGHLHLASMAPGAVRGNHKHSRSNELIMAWGGRALWRVETDDGYKEFELAPPDLTVVEIPAGIGHALKNVDDHIIYLMSYYDRAYDLERPDTEPCPLFA